MQKKPAHINKNVMRTPEGLPDFYVPPKVAGPLPDKPLFAVTNLDGRDRRFTRELAQYCSEFATFTTRAEISGKYLIALSDFGILPRKLTEDERGILDQIGNTMTEEDVEEVKTFERQTNHDVVALRLHMKKKFQDTSLSDFSEFIDLGLTSEDKNNLTFRLNLLRGTHAVALPALNGITDQTGEIRKKKAISLMQARTHGQAAGPTTAEKEFAVFDERLKGAVEQLGAQHLTGKLNGAVGNFNSLRYVYPEKDWLEFSRNFVTSLGLVPNEYTTQINPYDDIAEYLQSISRVNNILASLSDDVWHYIADNWIVQIPQEGESGSSAMPQKVNPIDWEKAEGNLEVANDLIEGLARRLPRSRFQRDLRDSTQIRNIGAVLGFSMVGYQSILTGFRKIAINEDAMRDALNSDWTILSEAIQIYLRGKTDVEDPYELMKKLVRGNHMNREEWWAVIDGLPVNDDLKAHFKELTPETYLGYAVELAEGIPQDIRPDSSPIVIELTEEELLHPERFN